MRRLLILIFLSVTVYSCGYKLSGYNAEYPIRFYINIVENDTIDTRFGDIVQKTAERYFIKYGELASYKNATYFMDIKISDILFEYSILSATEEALSSYARYNLDIIVMNIDGQEIFAFTYKGSESFSMGQEVRGKDMGSIVARSIKNRDKAIQDSLEDAFEAFRRRFNAKIYNN